MRRSSYSLSLSDFVSVEGLMSLRSSSPRTQRRKMVSTSSAGAEVFFSRHSQAASSAMNAILCSGSMKCFFESCSNQCPAIVV